MENRQLGYAFRERVYEKVVKRYGEELQSIIAIEEMSEVQKELCKFLRGYGNIEHLAEEVADAYIMLEQVERIYGIAEKVTAWMDSKVGRLVIRLQADEE